MPFYPERTISVGLLGCPQCIDEFAFDFQRTRHLAYGWRFACVVLRSETSSSVMQGYQVVHYCDATESASAGLVSYQSLGISMEDEFELRHEPAYRSATGWMPALISHDIRTLQIPKFLDIVADTKPSSLLVDDFACELSEMRFDGSFGGQNHLPPWTTIAAR